MPNNYWRTPKPVFDNLHREFNFVADMACTPTNKLLPIGFGEAEDSLSFNWFDVVTRYSAETWPMWVFTNPPYDNPMPWIKKALEAQHDGLGVVMLLNSDHSVGWFAEALKGVSEIREIIADESPDSKRGYSSGRLAFLDATTGKPVSGNSKPQVILVFHPHHIGAKKTVHIPKSELYS